MKKESNLQKILKEGHFAVTAEAGPPRGCDPEIMYKKAGILKGYVDAVNVTDNQTAIVRMSSLAACSLVQQSGVEPILQMVVRDRNRIALQSDVLGAAALGITNMMCLSGDHQCFGNQPGAMGVFDLDSIQLIAAVKKMRDESKILGGDELTSAPQMFIGAAANPFADPLPFRVTRLAKKVKAGAGFIQTQCIYNLARFKEFMKMVTDQGLDRKVYILAGITPLKSAGMAKYMARKVAGMDIPEEIIRRMEGVPKADQPKEGISICLETIAALKKISGVSGIHIMAIEWEEAVPEIVSAAGLMNRGAGSV